MTPKEKAIELVELYCQLLANGYYEDIDKAKEYALIVVDEVIKETKLHDKTIYQHGRTFYWQEVKQEIEKV